jgi:phosphoribosylanthranilate isomerase
MRGVAALTRIKICGITNVADARCAVQAGADFLGFIFYPPSPRYVTPEQAAGIVGTIQETFRARAPLSVGVFVDEPVDRVREVLGVAKLDVAQLHGNESPEQVQQLGRPAFKALRPQSLAEAEAALATYRPVLLDDETLPQLLVDAYHPHAYGGTGTQADLWLAEALARRVRLLLAGGLTPETVGAVIRQVRPWGVDVSSGVERQKGVKDHARVQKFVEAVRAEDARSS